MSRRNNFSRNRSMTLEEELETLSNLAIEFLRKMEPEPYYVKKYIEGVSKQLQEKGWWRETSEAPWVETFKREGYKLKIAFIHARKGEIITGADLLFEIKDRKVIFVQSKRAGQDGRIHFNRFQLQKLIELEAQISGFGSPYSGIDIHELIKRVQEWLEIIHDLYHKYERYPIFVWIYPFIPQYYLPYRSAFYHLIMINQNKSEEERFFHTSEILFTLGNNKSVSQKEFLNHGLNKDEFQEMFWECKIGGPDLREDIKKNTLHVYSLVTNRLIVWLHFEKTK